MHRSGPGCCTDNGFGMLTNAGEHASDAKETSASSSACPTEADRGDSMARVCQQREAVLCRTSDDCGFSGDHHEREGRHGRCLEDPARSSIGISSQLSLWREFGKRNASHDELPSPAREKPCPCSCCSRSFLRPVASSIEVAAVDQVLPPHDS